MENTYSKLRQLSSSYNNNLGSSMKSYIDFYATLSGELLAKQKLASKLRKHWGTTTIDGIEVYNSQFTIWPGTETEATKKMLKILNIPIADIKKQSKDGLTRMYLQFNSSKMDTSSYSKEALATAIEEDIGFNEWREFTLEITDSSDPAKFIGWTKEQIKQYVSDNFETLSAGYAINADADTANVDDYLGVYVIASASSIDFEVVVLNAGIVPIGIKTAHDEQEVDYSNRWKNTSSYQSGINLRYKYRRIGYLNDDSPIIKLMYDDLQYGKSTLTKQEIATIGIPRVEAAQARSGNARVWLNKKIGKTDTLWYNGRLRTASSKLLKKHDYANVVFGSLDFGYDKKKTSGWKKALGIVLIVVAIVVAVLTVGTGSPLVAIAAGASAGALTATLYSMVLAKTGDYDGAQYMGRWAKVLGIVSLVAGIGAAIQGMLRQAAQASVQEAAKQAGQAAASELTAVGASSTASMAAGAAVEASTIASATIGDITMEGMMSTLQSSMTSMVSTPFSAMSTAMKVAGPLVEQREKNKAKQLDSLSAEVMAQSSEIADLYDKNLHMGLEDIRMYTKPINVDNAQFEVDYLYEGTKFQIQRPSFARYGLNIIT